MIVFNDIRTDARVTKEAETLVAAGYDTTVISVEGRKFDGQRKPLGFRVIEVSVPAALKKRGLPTPAYLLLRLAYYAFLYLKVIGIAWRTRAKVYHAHDVNTLPIGWLVSRLHGAKLVYDAHEISTNREGYGPVRWLVEAVERSITSSVDAMITTTDMRADHFRTAYKIPKPIVLQNRPTLYPFGRSSTIRDTLRLTLDLPIVLYQGVIQGGRGMHNIVEVSRRVVGAYFVFIGDGPQAAEIDRLIAAPDLRGRVFRISTVPLEELPRYTCSADIGLQVLRNTCFNHYSTDSNKLFEYVMAGVPVVASNFPEIARIASKHEIALLVDPHSIDEVVAAVQKLVTDVSLRKRLADNAIAARSDLSWEAQARVLTDSVYRAILAS